MGQNLDLSWCALLQGLIPAVDATTGWCTGTVLTPQNVPLAPRPTHPPHFKLYQPLPYSLVHAVTSVSELPAFPGTCGSGHRSGRHLGTVKFVAVSESLYLGLFRCGAATVYNPVAMQYNNNSSS